MRPSHGDVGMASRPGDLREAIKRWSRMSSEQRVEIVRQVVARSRSGDPVMAEMLELLALLRTGEPVAPRRF